MGSSIILDTRIIQLRHLIDFYFGFVDVDSSYALKVLSLFHFPSVQSLALEDVSFTLHPMELEHENATSILDWLTQSNASTVTPRTACGIPLNGILSLQLLDSIHASVPAFSRLFSALTSLQKLGLFNVGDLTLRLLHPSSNSESDPCHHHPCPNLRELMCRNVDPTTLVEVVKSRVYLIPQYSDDPLTHDDSDFVDMIEDVGVKFYTRTFETYNFYIGGYLITII